MLRSHMNNVRDDKESQVFVVVCCRQMWCGMVSYGVVWCIVVKCVAVWYRVVLCKASKT